MNPETIRIVRTKLQLYPKDKVIEQFKKLYIELQQNQNVYVDIVSKVLDDLNACDSENALLAVISEWMELSINDSNHNRRMFIAQIGAVLMTTAV